MAALLSGWVNRQQQEMIDFQNAQIRILMEKMGRKRVVSQKSITPVFIRLIGTLKTRGGFMGRAELGMEGVDEFCRPPQTFAKLDGEQVA